MASWDLFGIESASHRRTGVYDHHDNSSDISLAQFLVGYRYNKTSAVTARRLKDALHTLKWWDRTGCVLCFATTGTPQLDHKLPECHRRAERTKILKRSKWLAQLDIPRQGFSPQEPAGFCSLCWLFDEESCTSAFSANQKCDKRHLMELMVAVLGCRQKYVLGGVVAELAMQTGANLEGEEGISAWLEQKVPLENSCHPSPVWVPNLLFVYEALVVSLYYELNTKLNATPLLGFPFRAPLIGVKSPDFLSKSAPLELLVEILEYCHTMEDVISFALTCRRMKEAWTTGRKGLRVAWGLLKTQVSFAELALTTVRASRLALDARTSWSDRATCSPGIVLADLHSRCRLPSFKEMKAVQDLHMLAEDFGENFHEHSRDRMPYGYTTPATEPQAIGRALYRAFIAGAILAPLYAQPLSQAQAHQDNEISQPLVSSGTARPKLAEFLRQFPGYQARLEPQLDHQIFGEFGDWLLDDILSDTISRAAMNERFTLGHGRALGCERRTHEPQPGGDQYRRCPVRLPDDCGYTHADAHLVALELVRVYWICEQLQEFGLLSCSDEPWVGMHSSYSPLLLWHRFVPQTIYLHRAEPDTGFTSVELVLDLATVNTGDNVDAAMYEVALLDSDQWQARAAQGIYLPHLVYKFFVYFLRRHLNAAFEPGFFEEDNIMGLRTSHWQQFANLMQIFAKDNGENVRTYYPRGADMELSNTHFLDGTDLLVPWSLQVARAYGVEDEPGVN